MIDLGVVRPLNIISSLAVVSCTLSAGAIRASEDPAGKTPSRGVAGSWYGTLNVGNVELRLVARLSEKPDGTHTGTFDAPDSGRKDLPVDKVVRKGEKVLLKFKVVPVSFEGTLSKDNTEMTGTWTQAGQPFPVTLRRLAEPPAAKGRPQEPKRPYPYLDQQVTYENRTAGVRLAGTLTLPKGGGPFPAALLLSGTGPQDRDETLFGHHPFLVLTDALTRRGIAVLRVDDRGVGRSTGEFNKSTVEDFAADALAGLSYLKDRKEIDGKRIGLIGHSEGASVAAFAASRSAGVAFLVMMAGPGVSGEELAQSQAALMLKVAGASDEQIEKNRRLQRALIDVLNREKDERSAERELRRVLAAHVATLSAREKQAVGDLSSFSDAQIRPWLSPGFRYYLAYNPRPILMKVHCPVLALNGEKDLVVACAPNLGAIESALKAGGNPDFTIKALPGLNHLFQTCKTGAFEECSQIEETIAPLVLDQVGRWLAKRMESP
jgi:pimeloyl-ACP methyl ester carboxylesterase